MLQVVHGLGDTGAALGRAGVDKLAVIGSTATAKKVMATCAETLTPILAEGGGKDAMIVAADHPGRRPRGLDRGPGGDLGPGPSGNRVGDVEEGPGQPPAYALGGSVSTSHRRLALARRLRSGMTAVNSLLSFAATPSLPSGGVGDSGFGRLGGDDGLREFARSKAITTRRAPSLLPAWTIARDPNATTRRVVTIMRLLYGRPQPPQPPRPTPQHRR